jgi:sulfatase maturation enzyme AslB (radical SAM superfamily)
MELYTAEKKVQKLMESNPTIPEEAFEQLVNEKFYGEDYKEIMEKEFDSNLEVDVEDGEYRGMKFGGTTNIDPEDELDFENRQND